MYDYVIVGAGLFGSVCAYELRRSGHRCLVLEKRQHVGGNCYTSLRDDIHVHEYGPHIFHTTNGRIWSWMNQFARFNNFVNSPVASYRGELYSLPFNMWTFYQLLGVKTPQEARVMIPDVPNPQNLEEQAVAMVGQRVYDTLIKDYTEKQWGRSAKDLPAEIIKRLKVRFTFDNRYFDDPYQGVPIGGYTRIFEQMLEGIEVRLGVDFLKDKDRWMGMGKKVIYTGPIDAFYDYRYGRLEYRSLRFEHKRIEVDNYQGVAVMNYTDDSPQTRTVEHRHFEDTQSPVTWVTWEYPADGEGMYPVNDKENGDRYMRYRELQDDRVLFGGRLAEYKYYNMDQVVEAALDMVQ